MMNLPDFLRQDDLGEIFFTGHRITLYQAMQRFKDGCSPEAIVEHYPTLPLTLAHKAVAFYLENREEVNKYLEATHREIARQAALPPKGPSSEELSRRFEAQRQAESA